MINSPRADGEIFFVGKRHIFAGNTLCISRKCNAFPAENSRQMPKVHLISVYFNANKSGGNQWLPPDATTEIILQ